MLATVPDLIAEGLDLRVELPAPTPLPDGTRDAITGVPITHGYAVMDLVTEATTEFLEQVRGDVNGYVGVNTARCFRAQNPRGENRGSRALLAFGDGTAYLPLIARERATAEGRPCWSDLVRAVWTTHQGQPMVGILTTDQKKRLWPRARSGVLAAGRVPLFVYDTETAQDGTVWCHWPLLLAILDAIERAYALGAPKRAIATSLLAAPKLALTPAVVALERHLAAYRPHAEFPVALLIAQRPADYAPPTPPTRRPAAPVQGALF
jgi:hypothetical protein